MSTRIPKHGLPGVAVERTITFDNEEIRHEVFRDGIFVGTVVYVRRRHRAGGSTYGWRPERSPRSRLTSQHDAILSLPRMA